MKQFNLLSMIPRGEFWTSGYFASSMGYEELIMKYVSGQGKIYTKIHKDHQLALFWYLAACRGVIHLYVPS